MIGLKPGLPTVTPGHSVGFPEYIALKKYFTNFINYDCSVKRSLHFVNTINSFVLGD